MSRVLKIRAADDVVTRAQEALDEELQLGRIAEEWRMGREVYNRMRRDNVLEFATLLGIPFKIERGVPPDMLELIVF